MYWRVQGRAGSAVGVAGQLAVVDGRWTLVEPFVTRRIVIPPTRVKRWGHLESGPSSNLE